MMSHYSHRSGRMSKAHNTERATEVHSPDEDYEGNPLLEVTTENIDQTFFQRKQSDHLAASSSRVSMGELADTAPFNAIPLTSPLANPVFQTSRNLGKGGVRVYLNKLCQPPGKGKN